VSDIETESSEINRIRTIDSVVRPQSGQSLYFSVATDRPVCVVKSTYVFRVLRCTMVTLLLSIIVLEQTETVTPRSVSVTETSDNTSVHATVGTAFQGIVNITSGDVERHLQQNDSVVIDVRRVDEVAEFGQIPSAHVLPGETR